MQRITRFDGELMIKKSLTGKIKLMGFDLKTIEHLKHRFESYN